MMFSLWNRIKKWWKARRAKGVITGKRAVFKLNGQVVPFAKGVIDEGDIGYEPVEVLELLKGMEFVPPGYRATLTCQELRILGQPEVENDDDNDN